MKKGNHKVIKKIQSCWNQKTSVYAGLQAEEGEKLEFLRSSILSSPVLGKSEDTKSSLFFRIV